CDRSVVPEDARCSWETAFFRLSGRNRSVFLPAHRLDGSDDIPAPPQRSGSRAVIPIPPPAVVASEALLPRLAHCHSPTRRKNSVTGTNASRFTFQPIIWR